MDLFVCKIVTYAISERNVLDLARDILGKISALKNFCKMVKCGASLFRKRHGCLYTSPNFRKKLKAFGFVQRHKPTRQLLVQHLHGTFFCTLKVVSQFVVGFKKNISLQN